MRPFTYAKPAHTADATKALKQSNSAVVAGGTNLLDLMKLSVSQPTHLVDINKIAELSQIKSHNGGLLIGALVRNSDLAHDKLVLEKYPMLSQAILSGASAQIRNMASTAGNLLQRTRCYYFRNSSMPCNKREPGSGCPALDGYNRIHAILGTSDSCIATHPSDMAVALVALDAVIHIDGSGGKRTVPINKFYTLPGAHPEKETVLKDGELITSVEIPALSAAKHSRYLKIRDRKSFAFALISVACALEVQNGVIKTARLALGGVGTIPWRCVDAEKLLVGKPAKKESFKLAAEAAVKGAATHKHNKFKVELTKRSIIKALSALENLS